MQFKKYFYVLLFGREVSAAVQDPEFIMPDSTPDPKAYLILLAGGKDFESYLLTGVSKTDFMGVPCLKGTYRAPRSHWMSGTEMYVPIPMVRAVNVYPTYDAYLEALKRYSGDRVQA